MNLDDYQPKERKINPKYWDGTHNKFIRYYYYVQRGLAFFNEFRYLIMAIFGLYYTLKMDNPFLIPVMFVICTPFLLVIGYLYIHKMAKIMEYYTLLFSTHWGLYTMDLTEQRNKLLEEILHELRTKRDTN